MNRIPKLVLSRTVTEVSAWSNSQVVDQDPSATVKEQIRDRDVIVAGSASVVRAPAEGDLVDEYRILLFPTALGSGTRLFASGAAPTHLRLLSAESSGQAVLLRYERQAS